MFGNDQMSYDRVFCYGYISYDMVYGYGVI